jgi:hypothetical protein
MKALNLPRKTLRTKPSSIQQQPTAARIKSQDRKNIQYTYKK